MAEGLFGRVRAGAGDGSVLTRLTVVEVWLVRATLPLALAAVLVGGTAGAVTLVQAASTTAEPSDGAAAPADGADDAAPVGDPEAVAAAEETPAGADAPAPEAVEPTDGTVVDPGPPDYAAILTRRFPGAQWSLNGSAYAGLIWISDGTPPTRAELDALWPAVAAELAAERRAAELVAAERAAERAAQLAAAAADPDRRALVDRADPLRIFGPTPDYAAILSRRFPGAQWSLNANDPDQLVWLSGGTAPTRAQLDALWHEVARERALELPEEELRRWAGTSATAVYVDGVLRPKGWVGGANDPQPPGALAGVDPRLLPQLAQTGGGSPVGTLDILKDPTGGQNFEQKYGLSLSELADRIAAAHGYWGGSHSLGLSLNGDATLMWYSDQVDPAVVADVLAGIGAVAPPAQAPAEELAPSGADD